MMLSISVVVATANTNVGLRDITASLGLQGVVILDEHHSSLYGLGPSNVLFVDGEWFEVLRDNATIQQIKGAILNGVPVIIFGGKTSLIYSLVSTPVKETTNQPTIASGVYLEGDSYSFLFVGGHVADGIFHKRCVQLGHHKAIRFAFSRDFNII